MEKSFFIRQTACARMLGVEARTLRNWTREEGFPELARKPISNEPIGYIRRDVEKWMEKTRR